MTTTVSAKIPDDLKQSIEEADINVSDVIRNALEEEVRNRRRDALRSDATALRDAVGDGVETETIVSAVREAREER